MITDTPPPRPAGRTMTVTVGPFPIYFGNVNLAMGLRGHHHTAAVLLEYETPIGQHGYPSFRETNDAIRDRLQELTGTRNTFRDATNEDVAERLFDALHGWADESWEIYGGCYELTALHLDVQGVHDDIGHDEGTTRYTVRQTFAAGGPVTGLSTAELRAVRGVPELRHLGPDTIPGGYR